MPKTPAKLSDLEMEILQILSEKKGATAQEVKENMLKGKELVYSTVITLLQRMETKGLVHHTKAPKGKAFVFHAKLKPEQVQKNVAQNFFRRYFQNNPLPAFMTLVETRGLTPEEIKEFRKLLDEMENQSTSKETQK